MGSAKSARPTRILAGIDEAGLGPLLGPLVIGYSAFELPRELADLWAALASVVSRDPQDDGRRLVVADSKLVHARNPRGNKRLETTALSFLACRKRQPEAPPTAEFVFAGELAPARVWLGRHPWYADLARPLPWWTETGWIELRRARLAASLEAGGISLCEAGVRVLPEGELNAGFEETSNKSLVLWRASAEALELLWRRHADRGLRVICDRQGGRLSYGALLAKLFPGVAVREVERGSGHAEYELVEASTERFMRVLFAEKADQKSFPVALSSCLAKYARECCMAAFNRYWQVRAPTLLPTAGYVSDGRRWLEDAAPLLRREGVDRSLLVRSR